MGTKLPAVLAAFNDVIGLEKDKLFAELEAMAARQGIDLSGPLPDAFVKQAKALYDAYVNGAVLEKIRSVGFAEVLELFKSGRVPKRKKRVGASTA